MKICNHFKAIIAIGVIVVVEKLFVIPVMCYLAVAAVYAAYVHKDEIVNFVKSKF